MATARESTSRPANRCKILIIGAGMAGLSAANHLVKNGISDFKILEARNRIGGRIASAETENHTVELGANWIHGVLGNPMYEIAMANGLIDIVHIPKPHRVVAATEQGRQIPFQMLQEIYEAYVCFLRRCEEYFLCNYEPPTGVASVGEHIALESALYLDRECHDTEERRLRQLVFDCLLRRETCITGCHSMDEVDLLELGSYTELQGGNIALPGGYSSILGPVASTLPDGSLLTGHPVSTVWWREDAVTSPGADSGIDHDAGSDSDDSDRTVTGSDGPQLPVSTGGARVLCEGGQTFVADHVICTVPLGVLKEKASTMFVPPLPPHKMDAIGRLLFGTVDKIFLEYERPFLNPNISELMLLWEPLSSEQEDVSSNWFRKIYSFSKVTETLLLAWISGHEAEYMETLPLQEVSDRCTEILRTFLGDPFVPQPKLCICTSWASQPYSRGSYSAIAVGASQSDIEQLAQPLFASPQQRKPTLLFAGEHTHSSFYSTVHGAYLTGRSAAQMLVTPDSPAEMVMSCEDTSDLSSWIQGIALN